MIKWMKVNYSTKLYFFKTNDNFNFCYTFIFTFCISINIWILFKSAKHFLWTWSIKKVFLLRPFLLWHWSNIRHLFSFFKCTKSEENFFRKLFYLSQNSHSSLRISSHQIYLFKMMAFISITITVFLASLFLIGSK